jgi:hypothetical protein
MLFESGEGLSCEGLLAQICAEEGHDLLGFREKLDTVYHRGGIAAVAGRANT